MAIGVPACTWGLLLPIAYRGEISREGAWQCVQAFFGSILDTTSAEERSRCTVYIGVDDGDLLFHSECSMVELERMAKASSRVILSFLARSRSTCSQLADPSSTLAIWTCMSAR